MTFLYFFLKNKIVMFNIEGGYCFILKQFIVVYMELEHIKL